MLKTRSTPPTIRLKCAQIRLWLDSSELESAYDQDSIALESLRARSVIEPAFDQTQVRSNPPMIRFKCARQSPCARSALESS